MKSAILISLIAAAAAQDVASLSQCGQTCANNMQAESKAAELGCKQGDFKCLCLNINFLYGLRDCSRAICNEQDANKAIEYGVETCKKAGVPVVPGPSGSNTPQVATLLSTSTGTDGTAVIVPVATSTIAGGSAIAQVTTIVSTSTGTDGTAVVVPVATSTLGGGSASAQVTTILSTSTGTDGTAVVVPVATSTIGGAAVSTYTSNGSQVVTTLTSQVSQSQATSEAPSSGSSSTGSGSESTSAGGNGQTGGSSSPTAAATTSSKNFAPQMTAAPGLLAVAGLAALLM